MRLYKLILTTIIALMFATGSAMAFKGVSIGVFGSTGDLDANGHEIEGSGDQEKTTTSKSTSVEYGGIFAEATGGTDHLSFTVGISHVPGSASWDASTRTDATSDAKEDSQDDGTYTGKAEVEGYTTLYVEPGVMFNESFGVYGKAGGSVVTVNTLESIAIGTDSSAYGNVDVWGATYGVGLKYVSSAGLFIKLEHTETDFDEITLNSTTGNKNNITADIDVTATTLAIGYTF